MNISKHRLIFGSTIALITTVAVTGAGIRFSQSQAFFRDSPKEIVDEVWQIVDQNYVDATFNQVDWSAVRQEYLERSYTDKEEAYKAIKEMLEKLGDPYTRFMTPEEFENMQVDTSGELTGVGIQIAKDEETGKIVVIAPIEDTPAFDAGILSKDIIVKINEKTTEGMDVNDAVQLIRGKPNTEVTLTIRRGDRDIEYPLVRKKIVLHPVKFSLQNTNLGKVGYIRLTQFSAQASKDMEEAIKNLEEQNVQGYVLDLRSNPGGLLYSSIDIARMWLKEGTIVSTVNRVGETDRQSATGSSLTIKPLVVLIDGGSASASEILSGALQDNKRGAIIGTKSFGKGLVQSVRSLGDGSGMAVTIAKYLTPNGRDINKHGIEPDVVIELSEDQRKELQKDRNSVGTDKDPQFAKALEVLSGEIRAQGNLEKTTSAK